MLYLIGGFAILCGLLLLVYLFINADPVRLARRLKWIGIGIALAVVAALALTGRLFVLLAPLAMLIPMLARIRSLMAGFRSPAADRSSTVVTASLRMSLDHDTGTMTGTVLRGGFAGMRVEELGRAQLLALLRECRTGDEEGARLLEAYLDRIHPDWHDEFAGEQTQAPGRGGSGEISIGEAYAILGLAPGADADAIRAAHHRLMKQLHPDHGGSDYFAARINRARDVLIHGR